MKKLFIIYFLLLAASYSCYAQVLSAIVCDNETKKPIPDVDVYFQGTSLNTKTDKNGEFKIPIYTMMNTNLVIDHLSYRVVLYPSPFDKVPPIIYLDKEVHSLAEVVVTVQDKFSRKEKMNVFKENFLGTDRAAKSCIIENEDDINLFYNIATRTLTASSTKPLIIKNGYLGYEVVFNLKSFGVKYTRTNTLNKRFIEESHFLGFPYYKEMFQQKNKNIEKRRKQTYEESSRRFFKNLVDETLMKSGYLVVKEEAPVPQEELFRVKDTIPMKMIEIIATNTKLSPIQSKDKGYLTIYVNDNKRKDSWIVFRVNKLLVDDFGNINEPDKVVFTGLWGEQRLSQMLPLDYMPDK